LYKLRGFTVNENLEMRALFFSKYKRYDKKIQDKKLKEEKTVQSLNLPDEEMN